MKNKILSISETIVFILVIAIIGVASFFQLCNYYINDEQDYNEWSIELGNKTETDIASNFYHKFWFVNMNGAIRNVLGQQEMNQITKLNNGYLLTTQPYVTDEILQSNVDAIIALNKYLDQLGIKFIYAIPPYTTSKYNPELPQGVMDWGNDNLDRFFQMLKQAGINTLDFREIMHEEEIDQYDMMYRTDHHWNTEAGFWAYTKLSSELEKLLDCEVDPQIKDLSNYTIVTYPNWHLGSRGQRTGVYFAGIDDFDLIIPDFETQISRGGQEGSFQDLIINMSALETRNLTTSHTYDMTLSNANLNYTNKLAYNDKKLLVLTDSFGYALNPYLIISYSEFRCMRNGLTYEYIADYKPDAIVMFYYVLNTVNPDIYNFKLPTAE